MSFSSRPNSRGATGFRGPMSATGPSYPQLDGQNIKQFIGNFSSHIKYWKAIKCPCMTPETGQPNIACSACRGLGWAYNKNECAPIFQNAQVHSRQSKRLTEAGGMITQGYASFTFMPGVVPGEGDLVQVMKDREVVSDEYHIVGSLLTDGTSAEILRFRDVLCVELVCVINMQTRQVTFLSDREWSYSREEKKIVFNPAYPIGTKYSVRYQAVPEYIMRQETAKPLLRVTHDDNLYSPYNVGGKSGQDIVYPYNCTGIRLDRAIIQRQTLPVNGDFVGGPFK